jgi:hypothetical protein
MSHPATYAPHPLHAPDRAYRETNCYTDVLIELLHAHDLDPVPGLGHLVRTDFEGDQFTFFKPPPDELDCLYGIDVHEMQPYRYLPEQAAELLDTGRTVIVELDSYWLPDTAATSYRSEHVKSSVVVERVDVAGQRLRYFHNTGLYDLHGEDFANVFTFALPPYTELVRFDAGPRLEGQALRGAARTLLPKHLARRPATNPFTRFGERLAADLPALVAGDPAGYHAYAFATVRMAGAAFELAAAYVDWLFDGRETAAAQAFRRIVEGSKTLSFKLARRRAFDPEPAVAALAAAWDEAQERLDAAAR